MFGNEATAGFTSLPLDETLSVVARNDDDTVFAGEDLLRHGVEEHTFFGTLDVGTVRLLALRGTGLQDLQERDRISGSGCFFEASVGVVLVHLVEGCDSGCVFLDDFSFRFCHFENS